MLFVHNNHVHVFDIIISKGTHIYMYMYIQYMNTYSEHINQLCDKILHMYTRHNSLFSLYNKPDLHYTISLSVHNYMYNELL